MTAMLKASVNSGQPLKKDAFCKASIHDWICTSLLA